MVFKGKKPYNHDTLSRFDELKCMIAMVHLFRIKMNAKKYKKSMIFNL